MTNPSLIGLFPIPIVRAKILRDPEAMLAACAADLNPVTRQTNSTDILRLPQFSDLLGEVEGLIQLYFSNILSIAGTGRITQSWANLSREGEGHHRHTHQNSMVSAVYYLKAPPGSSITFHRQNVESSGFTLLPTMLPDKSSFCAQEESIFVDTGDFMIFPSYLPHSVTPNFSGEDRWSLAMNAVTIGDIGGKMSKLTLEGK